MKKHVIVLVAALGAAACRKEEKVAVPPPVVRTVSVAATADADTVQYSGTVVADPQVELAFRAGGYVQEVLQVRGVDGRLRNVQEGDVVARGTLLARVRSADYQARVDQAAQGVLEAGAGRLAAEAQLAEAEAGLRQAELDWGRAQVLFRAEALTKPEHDAAEAKRDAARARVDAARGQVATQAARVGAGEAQRREAAVALGDTELRAPFRGVVLARKVELGTLVQANTGGFTLADLSTVKVSFGVPDTALAGFRLGAALATRTEAWPGEQFTGRVTSLGPRADESTRVFPIEVSIANSRGLLRPGMIATVALRGGVATQAVPTVPLSAVVRARDDDKGYAVFLVQRQNGQEWARRKAIELGPVRGNAVEVKRGLEPGERVVLSGGSQLADGQVVREVGSGG